MTKPVRQLIVSECCIFWWCCNICSEAHCLVCLDCLNASVLTNVLIDTQCTKSAIIIKKPQALLVSGNCQKNVETSCNYISHTVCKYFPSLLKALLKSITKNYNFSHQKAEYILNITFRISLLLIRWYYVPQFPVDLPFNLKLSLSSWRGCFLYSNDRLSTLGRQLFLNTTKDIFCQEILRQLYL